MKFLEILNIDKVTLIKNIDGIALNKGHVKIHSPNIIIKFDTNFARFLGHIYNGKDGTTNVTLPKLISLFLARCFKDIQKKAIPLDYLLLNQSNIKEFYEITSLEKQSYCN
mgnify:FL=1